MSAAAGPSARPDAHTQRYDRQLRLWASSGQASLESGSVLLIGATPTGCSILKNLVLPGLGSFTILDPRTISDVDKGANFFLDPDAQNGVACRAEEAVKLLGELNPNVKGNARHDNIRQLLAAEPSFFTTFTLIVASDQPADVLSSLSDICWQPAATSSTASSSATSASIPLISVRTSGFISQTALQVKELGIIETHPESIVSLRLASPWPELEKFALEYDINPADSMERQHVPLVVILLRMLHKWRAEHDGAPPDPSKDRKAFTDSIYACKHPDETDNENLDEAVAALNSHVWRPIRELRTSGTLLESDAAKVAQAAPGVPAEVKALFEDSSCDKVDENSSNFWLLVRALRSFVQALPSATPPGGGGFLPQPGALPDMKALSETYISLQRLYHAKAEADLAAYKEHLAAVLKGAGVASSAISDEEVRSFVKHAAFLVLIRGRQFKDQISQPQAVDAFAAFTAAVQPPTLPYHIAFLAAQEFYSKHSRLPGASKAFTRIVTSQPDDPSDEGDLDVDIESDSAELRVAAKKISARFGADTSDEEIVEVVENAANEVARGAHSSLPSTAALTGGIVAQEIIKLITRQYVPANNTVVYDGVKQATGVFKL